MIDFFLKLLLSLFVCTINTKNYACESYLFLGLFIRVHSTMSFITRLLYYFTLVSQQKCLLRKSLFCFIINDFFFVAAFPQDQVTLVRQSVNISVDA